MTSKSSMKIVLIILASVTLLINIVGCFIMPDNMQVQITTSGLANGMNKFIYLPLITVIVGACTFMGMRYSERTVKYLVVSAVITVANIAAIVINLL